jgi:hypothetical protein
MRISTHAHARPRTPAHTRVQAGTFMDYASATPVAGMTTRSFRPLLEGKADAAAQYRGFVSSGLVRRCSFVCGGGFVSSGLVRRCSFVCGVIQSVRSLCCSHGEDGPSLCPRVDGWTLALERSLEATKRRCFVRNPSRRIAPAGTSLKRAALDLPSFGISLAYFHHNSPEG